MGVRRAATMTASRIVALLRLFLSREAGEGDHRPESRWWRGWASVCEVRMDGRGAVEGLSLSTARAAASGPPLPPTVGEETLGLQVGELLAVGDEFLEQGGGLV